MADTTTGTSTTKEAPFRRHSETICEAAASEAPIAQVPIAMWMREERFALSNSSWRIGCGGSLDASGVIGFGFSAAEAELPLSRRRGLAGGGLPLVIRRDGLAAATSKPRVKTLRDVNQGERLATFTLFANLARRTTAGPVETQTVEGAEQERLAGKILVPLNRLPVPCSVYGPVRK